MRDTSTVYGGSTIPPKEVKQSKICCTLRSPVVIFFTVGILIGFGIGNTIEPLVEWYEVRFYVRPILILQTLRHPSILS